MSKKMEQLRKHIAGSIRPPVPGIGEGTPSAAADVPYSGMTFSHRTADVAIERLVTDAQPRETFDEASIAELAASIRTHGQLAAIRVKWDPERKKWKVLVGERRYRACLAAGLPTIRCELVEGELSPSAILAEQIVENLHREGLRPLEEAKGFQELKTLNGWNNAQLAEYLGISKAKVSKSLALLRLPEEVQTDMDAGKLPASTAYQISKLDSAEEQTEVAKKVTTEKLTRDESAEHVRRRRPAKGRKAKRSAVEIIRTANGIEVHLKTARRHTVADRMAALTEALECLSRSQAAAA